jgi:hypothetical protein
MKKPSSLLQRGISIVKFILLFSMIVPIATLGVQQVFALPERSSFIGNTFNITPSTSSSSQLGSSVAYDSNLDQWLVVWKDNRNGANYGIYGRLVDKDANLLNSTISVLYNSQNLDFPSVAFDSAQSRYLVVWENNSNGNIEGRVLNVDGSYYGDAFLIADCTDCSVPDVAYNPLSDEYLVVWQRNNSVTDKDVRGRRVGVDGTPDPGGDFDIASGTDVVYQSPALAVASNGKYMVVFSRNTTGNFNIGGQRLAQSCSKDGGVLSISSDSGDELSPDVAFNLTNNTAFVAWAHDTGGREVKGRLVRPDNSMGGQPTLSAAGGSDEQNVSLAYAFIGDPYLATWDNGVDVFGRWVSDLGAVTGSIFTVTSTNTQYAPSAAFGADRFLVTYSDWSGQYDVWGRFGTANPCLFLPIIRK